MLTEPDRKKLEEGGEFETVGNRHARWGVEIESTSVADVFKVAFTCEISDSTSTGPEKLVQTSKEIPRLFPEGSLDPKKSAAKPEIWAKWSDFESAAKNLQTQSEKLRDTAKTGNAAATQQVVQTFGRQACGTCHTPFRVPPKQS